MIQSKCIFPVDGFRRCEKWTKNDNAEPVDSKESMTTSWFKRFIGREQKPEVTWSFPFAEGRVFVLTLRAGIDGFHINVGGRHVTSFPYRPVCFHQMSILHVICFINDLMYIFDVWLVRDSL